MNLQDSIILATIWVHSEKGPILNGKISDKNNPWPYLLGSNIQSYTWS